MNEIEVWADVWCPFAHIGIRRLVEERDRRGSAVHLRVRAWPLELVNGRPLDAAFIAEEIDEIRPQVAPDLFVGFRQDAFPSSSTPRSPSPRPPTTSTSPPANESRWPCATRCSSTGST